MNFRRHLSTTVQRFFIMLAGIHLAIEESFFNRVQRDVPALRLLPR